MHRIFLIVSMAILVGGMGSGGDRSPPSRVNPPTAAEVDAAQTPQPATPAGRSDTPALHILPASETTPDEFLWQARPVVVFADTAADPAFRLQIEELHRLPAALAERDVVVITDTDPDGGSAWRQRLHPRGFSLVIMDKDGQIKQRKPQPWSVREITLAIDKFPLRREEIGSARLAQ